MTRYPRSGLPSSSLLGTAVSPPVGTAPAGVRLPFVAGSRQYRASVHRVALEGCLVRLVMSLLCAWLRVSSSELV